MFEKYGTKYLQVKKRTRNTNNNEGSHVMQYGTLRISNETVSVYQGSTTKHSPMDLSPSFDSMGVVNQRDADLYSMQQRVLNLKIDDKLI